MFSIPKCLFVLLSYQRHFANTQNGAPVRGCYDLAINVDMSLPIYTFRTQYYVVLFLVFKIFGR